MNQNDTAPAGGWRELTGELLVWVCGRAGVWRSWGEWGKRGTDRLIQGESSFCVCGPAPPSTWDLSLPLRAAQTHGGSSPLATVLHVSLLWKHREVCFPSFQCLSIQWRWQSRPTITAFKGDMVLVFRQDTGEKKRWAKRQETSTA